MALIPMQQTADPPQLKDRCKNGYKRCLILEGD